MLCGQTIHVERECYAPGVRRRFQTYICQVPHSDAQTYDRVNDIKQSAPSEDEEDDDDIDPFAPSEDRHAACHAWLEDAHARTEHFSLSLLRTSRQIYTETRLVPLSEGNIFSFPSAKMLDAFIHVALGPDQRKALQSIAIVEDTHGWFAADYRPVTRFSGLSQRSVDMLTGLSNISLVIDEGSTYSLDSGPRFWKCPDAKVKVLLTPYGLDDRRDVRDLRDFAEEIEHALVRTKESCKNHWQAGEQLDALRK